METLLFLIVALFAAAAPAPYAELKGKGEAFVAEKSFAKAHAVYEEASRLALPPEEKRWVEMRLADTAWRADEEPREDAQKKLEALALSGEHDRVYAEANESLGDYTVERDSEYQGAIRWYTAALDWWAGSDDLPLARKRYLEIVFRTADGESYNLVIPKEILANAVAIAETPDDRAHARMLYAARLLTEHKPEPVERALELLDEVIAMGKTTSRYDEALNTEAAQLSQWGAVVVEDGQAITKPDNVRALALYHRIVSEFTKNESPYYDSAQQGIATIEQPSLTVYTVGSFLPKSEQQIHLNWRNVKAVGLEITAIDLTTDAHPGQSGDWMRQLPATGRSVRRWTFDTNDRGDHAIGNESIRIQPKLEPGAYVVVATAGTQRSQALLLITDANVITHYAAGRIDAFVCNAETGEPMANARVRVWRETSGRVFKSIDATTGANGLATIRLDGVSGYSSVYVFANAKNRQAWVSTGSYSAASDGDRWQIYAFTDRPAYRPEETVHWKFVARMRRGNEWVTPAKHSLEYEIVSPRGEKITSGTATLNEFGSFWADLPLTAAMPLGLYSVQLIQPGTTPERRMVGTAQLFRLEEYKLPEFRVDVKTANQFRTGDTIEANIDASYYFGGPVANATVEAVVRKSPFVHSWTPWREYAWYFTPPFENEGSEVKKETLKTDAQGRAVLRIETTADDGDSNYTIEARVTDASRREVSGEGKVNVTKQSYSVAAQPEHYLLRPNDDVSIRFKALDPSDQPVQTTGTVKVVRRRWQQPSYRDEEVVTTATLSTDKDGEATLRFRAPREGYYSVQWTSEDRGAGALRARDLVHADTAVYVTSRATTEIGYHAAGLELIVDKESFHSGQTAPVMVVTPASGRWVLFTSSGDEILDTQELHLDGTVKLLQLQIDDRHVPSFGLTASSVFERTLSTVAQTIVVPPVDHFLKVEVKPDRADYEPRQQGTVLVSTRDNDGRPVRAEVALSVTDEAVTAIQNDLAGDPRQSFFGEMRNDSVTATASVQMQLYVNLIEEKGKLIDDRVTNELKKKDAASEVGGVIGGYGFLGPVPAPRPVSEAITVTAAAPMLEMVTKRMTVEKLMEITVRNDFRSTAFWQPDVVTGDDGTARVTLKYPEALTTWRATARAVTTSTQVGIGSATAVTKMPLIVRLEAPRFFVAGDRVTISAVINNNTDAAMKVTPSIDVEGVKLETAATLAAVDVPPHGESRADWHVAAEYSGPAKLRVTGRAAERGDAMEKSFTVYEHGIDKLLAKSGKLRGEDAVIKLDLPHDRRATALTVRVEPSIAAVMLDALPSLIDYPYGCTEQTMSRFLPAAIVARTLRKNGRDTRALEEKLHDVTEASTRRLFDFQHEDGGWGWWKTGSSDDFMTAYVVWGFALAKEAGIEVDSGAVHGVEYLDHQLVKEEGDWEQQAWMLHAIGAWRAATHDENVTAEEHRAIDNVWKHRDRLSSYSRALFTLAAHDLGDSAKTAVLIRNLEDGVKLDRGADPNAAETMAAAHWGADGFWWHWYEGPVESTAFALQALVRVDPQNKLIEPAMNWLVKNRRGAQWNNTRDTAIAVLALNDYLTASGELQGDAKWDVTVNGVPVSSTAIDPALVRDDNSIRIHRIGGKGLYFAIEGRFVSLEEPVKAAGNEIFVKREYVRLAPKPTLLKGITYDRVPLADGGTVNSGDRVEVIVTIESKNDYEYLLFEDLKPAGLEAVSLRSGESLVATSGDRTTWVYQELRDRKVALFIDHLPQGTWQLRYTLRAEVPGTFHALPILGQAMYVPEIHANGDEARVEVKN